ncbi:MAG: helix-turn-helix domain-containing protein, partial [Massilia sp.]
LCFADLYSDEPGLFGVFDWPLASMGPFYYLYVRSMTGLPNGRRQSVHFIVQLWLFGVLLWMRHAMPAGGPFSSTLLSAVFGMTLLLCQVLCFGYAILTFRLLHQHRRRVRENFSSTGERDLKWMLCLSGVILALLLIWIPATLYGRWVIWLLCAGRLGLLYFVGWYGLRSLPVLLPEPVAAPMPAAASVAEAPAGEKYARSGMTEAASELIGERLMRRVGQHRDYLENDLTLTQLAERIGATPQLLSQYLNHVLGLNFFDYVNGLRIAEVQKRMQVPEHAGSTLLELALACGFNSKSTFNASFKRVTGMAPSAWRAQLGEPAPA